MSTYNVRKIDKSNAVYEKFCDVVLGDPDVAFYDWTDNGFYVYVKRGHEEGELLKYNFSAKAWSVPCKIVLKRYGMKSLEPCKLLYFVSQADPQYHDIFSYDVKDSDCKRVAECPRKPDTFDSNLYCIKDGNLYMSLAADESNILYSMDLNTKQWQELAELPLDFTEDLVNGVCYQNKLFFFCAADFLDWPKFINCYDMVSRELMKLPTMMDGVEWTYDVNMYLFCNHNDSVFIIGIYDGMGSVDQSSSIPKKIRRLHLPSLTWSELPCYLPNTKLLLSPIITTDGQMYLCYEDGMYQINLCTQPRTLQNICWDTIVHQPRSQSLASYTDEHLFECGIPKYFLFMLRW